MYAAGFHSSEGKVTGEKRPVTELKLRTYALIVELQSCKPQEPETISCLSSPMCASVPPTATTIDLHLKSGTGGV